MLAQYSIHIEDKRGMATVVVLLVMTALTVLGVMSINLTTIELDIARNERDARENFYLAEGAAMEGIQRLVNASQIDLEEKMMSWHHSKRSFANERINFRNPEFWDADGRGEDNALTGSVASDTFIAAVEKRVATGSSAVVTESRLYLNQVYGLSTRHGCVDLVEIGYYLRY